ncbi:MAG: hypothetical protein JNM93_14510, partial [Bacteriovoracaceae bacterium]|nr:hypothetical protein [Bacteriovoracaceae bacterium]
MKLTLLILCLYFMNQAYSQQYELTPENQIERERMLQSIKEYEIAPVVFPEFQSAPLAHKKILTHYRQNLIPTQSKMEKLSYTSNIYHLLVDRAFYTSDTEKNEWQKIEKETNTEIRKLANSDEYLNAKLKLIELSEGLPDSNFTRYIKKMKEDFEFNKLNDEQQAIAKQISDEFININNILNTSPHVPEVQKYGPISQQVMKDFHAGIISVDEGRKILKDAYVAFEKHIEYYSSKGAENFANIAKQKTLLAKSKGFENYAHYALYEQRDGYQGELVEVDSRRQFLRNFLNETQEIAKAYLAARYQYVMKQPLPEKLPEFINGFLSPQTTGLIDEYFPKEKIVEVWRQTMRESGFSQETLEQIIVDEFPRDRKYYHAYLSSTKTPTPKKLSINAKTLEVKSPVRDSSWTTPESYVIQNFKTDGPGSATTAFHEGGHALENSFKRPLYLDN